jgi:peptide/nickel transport system substrate-binding protein
MDVREGVVWHDGTPFTPEDVVWSIERMGKPDSGNPVPFIWSSIDNLKVDGKRITADIKQFMPDLFKWMAVLTGYVLPKTYFEKVGPQGFEKKPIGSGPYIVDAYEGNAYLRLKANPKYWGGKPAFETVVFKFVPDATSRVAEIESGSSDVTLEVPYEEYDRLKAKAGVKGECTPVSDIGMVFITNGGVMDDKNVRLAMTHAVDKATIIRSCCAATVCLSTRWRRRTMRPTIRQSRCHSIRRSRPSFWPPAATRRKSQSSSQSKRRAALSRRTMR